MGWLSKGSKRPPLRQRVRTSWRIMRQAFHLLGRERDLWVLPLVSTAGLVAAMAYWFVAFDPVTAGLGTPWETPLAYVQLFVIMVPATFLMILFNAALAFALFERMEGRVCSVGRALRTAAGRSVTIFAYSLIAALVGLLFQVAGVVVDKLQAVPGLGRIVRAVGMFAWAVATYFVVPILVVERETSAVEAIRRSAALAKERWGESVSGVVTVGLALTLVSLPLLLLLVVGIPVWGAATGMGVGVAASSTVAIIAYVVVIAALSSALHTSYQTALYRYARTGEASAPFSEETLDEVWEPYREA